MHYRRNFLTKVIVRLDFDPVPALRDLVQTDPPPPFSARIAQQFPVVRGQGTQTLAVSIGPTGTGVQQEVAGVIWGHRRVENGTQVVVLAPEYLAIEYGRNDFDHFPPLRAHAALALDALAAEYPRENFKRLGLRYVNEIVLPQGNPLDWGGLLDPNLITSAKAGTGEGDAIIRSMHQLILRNGEYRTALNYGLFNPDYPNALARRQFVLDFDCSRMGPFPAAEALAALDGANARCETLFERSIADGLRDIMEIINE